MIHANTAPVNTEIEGSQPDAAKAWALRLFDKSPLKQKKYSSIVNLLGDLTEKTCLDIGSDNGVISLKLRSLGGAWTSADLIPQTVESIRGLVGERVFQIDGDKTPFADASFDLVVIVDFLEHITRDDIFVRELQRIVKPGGRVIFNVPNPRRGIVRGLRYLLGQTDAAHGHLRRGYSLEQLQTLTAGMFEIERHSSYSKMFSELIDAAITFALSVMKRGGRGQKGTVVTGEDLRKLEKSFKLYSRIYPLVRLFVGLDAIDPLRGNMLIAEARRN